MGLIDRKMRCIRSLTASVLASAALILAFTANAWSQGPPARSVLITLTQYGFEPREVALKPGAVYLIFRSRLAGRPDFQLIDLSRSAPVRALRDRDKSRGTELITLTPGTYTLIDTRFSQWKCTLRVGP